jgi:hypothetical protein
METRSKPGGWGDLLLLGFALMAWAVATAHLMVLLWRFVPTQAALFAGMGAVPPLGLKIAIAASNAMVRWLPFVVPPALMALGGAALACGLAAWRFRLSARTVLRALVAVAFAGLSVTVVASFVIVHSADRGVDRHFEQHR